MNLISFRRQKRGKPLKQKRSELQDPELLGLLLQGLLGVVQLLSHLWPRLLGHNVLQLHIQLLLLLNGETSEQKVRALSLLLS